MFPASVPNYPPFGSAPVVETFQPEEAACFGKFLGEPPPPSPPGSHAPLSLGARGAQCCACLAPPQLTSLVLPPPPFPSSPQGTLAPPAWLRQALLLQVGKLRPRSAPSNTPCEPGRECLVGSTAQERGGGGGLGWRTKPRLSLWPYLPQQHLRPRCPAPPPAWWLGLARSLAALMFSFVK